MHPATDGILCQSPPLPFSLERKNLSTRNATLQRRVFELLRSWNLPVLVWQAILPAGGLSGRLFGFGISWGRSGAGNRALQPPFRRLANPEHWRSQRCFGVMSCRYRDGKPEKFVRRRASRLQPGLAAPQRAKATNFSGFTVQCRQDTKPQKYALQVELRSTGQAEACPTKERRHECRRCRHECPRHVRSNGALEQTAKAEQRRPERPPAGTIACHTICLSRQAASECTSRSLMILPICMN